MNIQHYPANSRGHAHHDWLETWHSFSFAEYFNRQRMGFGALRVLNDDTIFPGQGFGMHPHENMEIITIPLKGSLEHRDSMGNGSIIKPGEIQLMSAGTGILHSEFNPSSTQKSKLFQIWIRPNRPNVAPRYDQLDYTLSEKPNRFNQLISPNKEDDGAWIHQDAWIHIGNFDKNQFSEYQLLGKHHGIFLFVISGIIKIGELKIKPRDAVELTELNNFKFAVEETARVLLIEVPV